MRAEAKRSSAANSDGSAVRGSVFGRRANATRASSLGAEGSGASSHQGRLAILVGAVAILALLIFAVFAQAKIVVSGYGTAGTQGGQFGTPRGIDVNNTGNGGVAKGTFYVVDGTQNRIERFTPAGAFDRAWGQNVVATGSDNGGVANEVQQITPVGSSGTFTLTFSGQTTSPIAAGASAATVQSALNALSTIGGVSGSVSVSGSDGGPYAITFGDSLAGTNVNQISIDGSGLGVPIGTTFTCSTAATAANITYRWLRNGTPITGATSTTYVTSASSTTTPATTTGDAGASIQCQVFAVNTAANSGSATQVSIPVNVVSPFPPTSPPVAPASIVAPTNSGTLTIGGATGPTLSCDAGNWTGGTDFKYQWYRNAVALSGNGATTSTYNVQAADLATRAAFQCAVTATNASGATTLISANKNTGTAPNPVPTASASVTTLSTVATTTEGASAPEICKAGVDVCQSGQGASAGGAFSNPQGVAVNQSNGHVYVTNQGNNRVDEFDADGSFIRAFGWDVITSGKPNDNATGYEVCDTTAGTPNAASDCKAGATGANGGQFGATIGQPILDSSNNLWVSDSTNRRIEEFSSTGDFLGAYGFNVNKGGALEKCTSVVLNACGAGTSGSGAGQFSGTSPGSIAFDSTGNLYAIDVGNNRVQKFDPTFTTASVFGAATFPAFTTTAPEQILATQGGTRLVFSVNNTVNAAERQLIELDPSDASVKDTSMVGAGLTAAFGGLASNATTGILYATTAATQSPRNILALSATPLPSPVLVVNAVATKTDTTATFNATIDPKGGLVGSCKFQYSTDQVVWTDVAISGCGSLVPSGGAQAVSANVTGLTPNTHYFVRLSVARPLVSNSTKTTGVQPFDTSSMAPGVSGVGAVDISDTSLRLVGQIDPKHSATGYVFQYGTTPALGSTTDPVDVGGGSSPLIVSQLVSNLKQNTTYYFKLVATNAFGTTPSTSATATTRATPLPLPDHRSYEQVSPPDKNSGDVGSGGASGAVVSWDGEAFLFCTTAQFGEGGTQQGNLGCTEYVSQRGADGWKTRSPLPRYCRADFNPPGSVGLGASSVQQGAVTPDIDYAVVSHPEASSCTYPSLNPTAPMPSLNSYRENLQGDPFSYDLLTPRASFTPGYGNPAGTFAGGSNDFGVIYYTSTGNQTDPPDSPAPNSVIKLYKWDHGTLSLVSKNPAGAPLSIGSRVPYDGVNSVSENGSRVFFETGFSNQVGPVSGQEVYLNQGGTTYQVSQSECTSSCGSAQGKRFTVATPDGSKAFVLSAQKLTDDDTSATSSLDLFMYTQPADPVANPPATDPHNLTLLSQDNEPSDGTNADVRGVIGVSDDGNTVYFAAGGQIISGAPAGAGMKIYRWRWNGGSPTVDYLATLDSLPCNWGYCDPGNWSDAGANGTAGIPMDRAVTPDGKYLVLFSIKQLDPVVDRDTTQDIYRWSASQGFVCLSCQSPGVPSVSVPGRDGGASVFTAIPNDKNWQMFGSQLPTVMSDDGQRVFFESPDALVPQDTNGVIDVYEWHDGAINLVSAGTGSQDSLLVGSSRDGRDVIFFTYDKLVGWDIDSNSDYYDARIDGGFSEPPATGAPCDLNGGACEGAPSVAPVATPAGTSNFQGPGNPPAKHKTPKPHKKAKPKKKHHSKKHAKRRAANHNRRTGR